MKVLWLSHFVPHPPTGHGALQRSHNLLVEACRTHEVHLVSLEAPGAHASREALEESRTILRQHAASVRTFPFPASRWRRGLAAGLGFTMAPSYWDRLFMVPAMSEHVAGLARTGFDLVHADVVFLTHYLAALRGVPLALNHHNIESDLLRRRAAAGSGAARLFFTRQARWVEQAERAWAPRAGVNLVVSDLDGERLQALAGPVPVVTVPNGVDLDFFEPAAGVAPQPHHMVFAGGMDWFPNREAMRYLARELWPALAEHDGRRRMTVVGRQPPEELVQAGSADPRLRVTGFVDDVRPYITEAPIYLCPITIGGGTRLKILDALSMQRALVSTDLGVEGLGLEDGVHYLRANTTAEFLAQVTRLEGDASLVARLGAAGRAFVEARYSWRGIGQSLSAGWRAATAHRVTT